MVTYMNEMRIYESIRHIEVRQDGERISLRIVIESEDGEEQIVSVHPAVLFNLSMFQDAVRNKTGQKFIFRDADTGWSSDLARLSACDEITVASHLLRLGRMV